MTDPTPPERDDLDAYLDERMQDPEFRAAMERAAARTQAPTEPPAPAEPAAPATPAKDPKTVLYGLGVGAVVALICIAGMIFHHNDKPNPDDDAKRVCEGFVKDRLKAPSTAKFSSETVTVASDGTYEVSGDVDAQNGFGAMIRNDFTCSQDLVGDNWHLVGLTGLDG